MLQLEERMAREQAIFIIDNSDGPTLWQKIDVHDWNQHYWYRDYRIHVILSHTGVWCVGRVHLLSLQHQDIQCRADIDTYCIDVDTKVNAYDRYPDINGLLSIPVLVRRWVWGIDITRWSRLIFIDTAARYSVWKKLSNPISIERIVSHSGDLSGYHLKNLISTYSTLWFPR